jgi:hypothetical protein
MSAANEGSAPSRRRPWARRIVVLAVLAGLVVAGDLAVRRIQFDERDVERRATNLLGLQVTVQEFHLELLPLPRFEAQGITVANLPDRPSPHLAEIGVLDLGFRVLGLLFGTLEIDHVRVFDADLYLEPGPQGGIDVPYAPPPSTGFSTGGWSLVVRAFDVDDLRIHYRAGEGEEVWGITFEDLDLSTPGADAPIELHARGELDGGPFDLRGELGPLRALEEPTAPYPFAVRGEILDSAGTARGTLADPFQLEGFDVELSARVDLSALDLTTGFPVSSLGPLDVSGILTDAHGSLGAKDLRVATVYDDALRLEVSGSVRDIAALQGVDLSFRIGADDADFLEPFVGRGFAGSGSFATDATLSDADGSLGVEGELHADWAGRVRLDVEGQYDDLASMDEVDVRSRLIARDVKAIGELLGLETTLPPIGPIDAAATLRDDAGVLGFDAISIEIGTRDEMWAQARGSIRDLLTLEGVRLEVEFGAADLRRAAPYVGSDLPDLAPVEGSAKLSDRDGSLGVEQFTLRAGREGLLDLEATGSFDDLRSIDEIDVDLRLTAQDLTVVAGAFGAKLPALGPIELTGSLTGSNERLSYEGKARIDRTRFDGKWRASFAAGERPRLWARLYSPHIHMEDLHIQPESDWEESDLPEALEPRPLPWYDHLRQVDLDVVVRADGSSGRSGPGPRFQGAAQLEDGDLVVDYRADGAWADVQARLRANAQTADPELELQLNVDGLDTRQVFEQLTGDLEQTGLLDLRADVTTRGRTPDEMRAQLDGSMRAMLRDGTLISDYARLFTFDIIAVSFPTFQSPSRAPRVACGVLDLAFERGTADVERLVLQGLETRVSGEGTFDLERGELDLTLAPQCFDPSLVRAAATVHVSGPIQRPDIRADARSIATSLADGVVSNLRRVTRPILRPLGLKKEPLADECGESLPILYVPAPPL